MKNGRKRWTAALGMLLAVFCLGLTGCAGRELEDREFPTVVTFPDADPGKLQSERQRHSAKFLDYGQVKAVVLEDQAAENPARLKEILKYLEETPAFARTVLVFRAEETLLQFFEEETEEEAGVYLENLYKNQPRDSAVRPVTLQDLLNEFYNGVPETSIPRLTVQNGKILTAE